MVTCTGPPARRGHLPDLQAAAPARAEIDPPPVERPAGTRIFCGLRREPVVFPPLERRRRCPGYCHPWSRTRSAVRQATSAASRSIGPPMFVNGIGFLPSRSETQISWFLSGRKQTRSALRPASTADWNRSPSRRSIALARGAAPRCLGPPRARYSGRMTFGSRPAGFRNGRSLAWKHFERPRLFVSERRRKLELATKESFQSDSMRRRFHGHPVSRPDRR